jgi:hypothetical protein
VLPGFQACITCICVAQYVSGCPQPIKKTSFFFFLVFQSITGGSRRDSTLGNSSRRGRAAAALARVDGAARRGGAGAARANGAAAGGSRPAARRSDRKAQPRIVAVPPHRNRGELLRLLHSFSAPTMPRPVARGPSSADDAPPCQAMAHARACKRVTPATASKQSYRPGRRPCVPNFLLAC